MSTNRIRVLLVSLLAVFAVSAVASASASAEGPHWRVPCRKVSVANKGLGEFNNAACTEVGGTKEFTNVLLTGETIKAVSKNKAGTSFILKGTLAGVKITLECTKVEDKSTLEGGGPGKDKNEIIFTKCTVTAPAESGCKVKEPITVKTITVLVFLSRKKTTPPEKWRVQTEKEYEEAPGKGEERAIGDEFKPETGTTFAEITLSGCNKAHEALNGTFPVKGTDTGIASGSLLEFKEETSSLTFGGNAATLTGTVEQEVEGGGVIEAVK
jgi:hypothetical protein